MWKLGHVYRRLWVFRRGVESRPAFGKERGGKYEKEEDIVSWYFLVVFYFLNLFLFSSYIVFHFLNLFLFSSCISSYHITKKSNLSGIALGHWYAGTGLWYHDGCWWPGAHFTNDFLPAIQIRWKLRLAVIPLLAIRSQQIFAHATTAQLSCHVQNFVAITVLESRWE